MTALCSHIEIADVQLAFNRGVANVIAPEYLQSLTAKVVAGLSNRKEQIQLAHALGPSGVAFVKEAMRRCRGKLTRSHPPAEAAWCCRTCGQVVRRPVPTSADGSAVDSERC